jgi:hypothetical protein
MTEDFAIDCDFDSGILKALHERFAKRAIEYTFGRNRGVFVMPRNYVVKIPKNADGFTDNDWEGSVSNFDESDPNFDPDDVQFARTRLFYYPIENDFIPILFMEYVKQDTDWDSHPDWVGSVDCGQVGYTKKGRLVAFDYGLR